ncbi:hypothetical protein TNCV_909711 [Trichonephila clavipes]|nr:hypothetical protein TNCV_909711 [Trichonephila clavipes]
MVVASHDEGSTFRQSLGNSAKNRGWELASWGNIGYAAPDMGACLSSSYASVYVAPSIAYTNQRRPSIFAGL